MLSMLAATSNPGLAEFLFVIAIILGVISAILGSIQPVHRLAWGFGFAAVAAIAGGLFAS